MIQVLIVGLLLITASTVPQEDKIPQIPGYPSSFTNRAFAGYLNTESELRKLHYVFVEGNKGSDNKDPVTLWVNGGPGCTSMMGMVQEIMSYCLEVNQKYAAEDALTMNSYSWLNVSNLLFIDAPAGSGYSINNDPTFEFTDATIARDLQFALEDFFQKFDGYQQNSFYLAGQAYAGQLIPQLASRLLSVTASSLAHTIKLKGLLIGNPVLQWGSLQEHRVEYLVSRNFVDPRLVPYWQRSCKKDASSAGCSYFYQRFQDLTYRISPRDVYRACYGRTGPPQHHIITVIGQKMNDLGQHQSSLEIKPQPTDGCQYQEGLKQYLAINAHTFKSDKTGDVPICNATILNLYKPSKDGSLGQIASLLQKKIKVYLFSGDLDSTVPFTNTLLNIERLGLRLQGSLNPWKVNDQHIGFSSRYSLDLMMYLVKGASQQVPLTQRMPALKLFEKFIYDV